MHQVKLAKQLVVITIATTLLAGTAAAHAAGPRSLGSGGASLTGLTPAVQVQARVPATPPVPATTPLSPGSGAIPPTDSPAPAASNTTTQTITQVQVSTCVSHCDGGSQVQQASQGNATVQAVGPPTPRDGGSPVAVMPRPTTRTSTSTPSRPHRPSSGVTQVQVGCLEHCYGTTTLDTSGLTLAQIEQLLRELQVPSPPAATPAPGDEQNTTQQTAAQSENADGHQSQAASQNNRTIQAVVTTTSAPADGGTGAGAVNQTAQGVVQLQVGCIFYCSGTQQTQRAVQSTATVQSVDRSGAGAANAVSRVVWQVQVGCLAWCYDASETQMATGSDSTVVAVAPPPAATAPVVMAPVPPAPPAPATGRSAAPRPGVGRTRDSGGAPVRVVGAGFGAGLIDTTRPALGASQVSTVSVSAEAGHGASLASVAVSQTVQTELTRRASVRAHRVDRHHRAPRPPGTARLRTARSGGTSVMTRSSTAQPDLLLTALLVLAALGFGVWRRREVR